MQAPNQGLYDLLWRRGTADLSASHFLPLSPLLPLWQAHQLLFSVQKRSNDSPCCAITLVVTSPQETLPPGFRMDSSFIIQIQAERDVLERSSLASIANVITTVPKSTLYCINLFYLLLHITLSEITFFTCSFVSIWAHYCIRCTRAGSLSVTHSHCWIPNAFHSVGPQ